MAVYLEDEGVNATLTTWIYCAMAMLWAAEKAGLTAHINWPNDQGRSLVPYRDDAMFARQANMFDWYFEQPHADHCDLLTRDETWTWQVPPPAANYGEFLSLPLDAIKAHYQKNLRLNADVCARGEALARKYDVDFTKTLGVTWRGTDCVLDGRPMMPIETYFPFIDDILTDAPDVRIACTAEEEGVLDALLLRYPQAFKIDEFFASPRGRQDNPERFSPFSGYERGMQPALMVWFFSQCRYYIKNRSSCAAVAGWLSKGHIVSLAHPENLGHGFDVTKAEIRGEIVPLHRG